MDAGGHQRRIGHAEMRGRCRMDHQRLGVADVGQVREHAQRFDELAAGAAATLECEAEHRAGAARQELLRQCMVGVVSSSG
jgi:hypothetical protein